MSASSDEIPLSLSLPRPLQASPVCEALQYVDIVITSQVFAHHGFASIIFLQGPIDPPWLPLKKDLLRLGSTGKNSHDDL